jgi:hypothetical protein
MTDPRRERDGGKLTTPASPQKQQSQRQHGSSTEGTNRDFDESGESQNQGHGHPREQRGTNPD